MKTSIKTTTTILAAFAAVTLNLAAQEAAMKPTTETITGDYQLVQLTADIAWPLREGAPKLQTTTLFLGFRKGQLASFWAAGEMSRDMSNWFLPGREATLTADGLKGQMLIKRSLWWSLADVPISFALTRSGAKLTGTITQAGKEPVPATGTVISGAELAKSNALTPGKSWPSWYGVDHTMRGPTSGLKLVESLSQARPVWRSEEALPNGFGNVMPAQGPIGGAASPVVADGRVFAYYYRPSGPVKPSPLMKPLPIENRAMPEFEMSLVEDRTRVHADDVIVAMDAATGQTLWRTVLPMRTANMQIHKYRGANPTPLLAGNALYVLNYVGRVYRLDPATGAVVWEYPEALTKPFNDPAGNSGKGGPVHCASPVLIGKTLAVSAHGKIFAIDAETGKELWQKPSDGGRLYACTVGGQPHFLTAGMAREGEKAFEQLRLFAPADGKEVWKAQPPFDFGGTAYMMPVLSGDMLFGLRFDVADKTGSKNAVVAMRLTATGAEKVWEVSPLPERFDTPQMTERDGYLYITGWKELWVIAVKDGKVVAKVPGVGGQATHVIFTAEDRVFIIPEGRHGNSALMMLTAAGPETKVLNQDITTAYESTGWKGVWTPIHTWTSAYAVSAIIHPIVDGRLFMRGANGIYCYDLRTSTK